MVNIDRIIRNVLNEQINKIIAEAYEFNCRGDVEWPDFIEKAEKFIENVNNFDKVYNDKKISAKNAKYMARCINNANLYIFKRNGYNVSSTDCLRSIYSIPLTLMYRTKDAMVTSLGLYIKNNPHKINGQVFYRGDELLT